MNRTQLLSVIALLLVFNISYANEQENSSDRKYGWKAGAASVDITPRLPMWMAGYGSRDKPGNEIALPIFARAVAMEDKDGKKIVIVSLEILGVPKILRKAVEAHVSAKFGINPSSLLINASHTHSGPEVRSIETFLEKKDQERTDMVTRYRNDLENKIVQAIGKALSLMVPAEVSYGMAKAGFAMNRRTDYTLPKDDFGYGKVPNPSGPVDHEVPVMQVKGTEGKIIALLFGYACHATTMGEFSFSGDYPGFAQHLLEEYHPGAVALFITGCGADQNPHPRRNMVEGHTSLDLAKMHGQTLALSVEAALNAHPEPVEARLESVLEEIPLEYLPAPSREELIVNTESKDRTIRENAQVLLEWLDRDKKLPESYPYPVQVIRFGNQITMIALASEVVVDYSLRIKQELPGSGIWVAAYSNDFLGYIPSRRILNEGGYEGGESMTFSGTTLYRGAAHPNIWSPSIEEKIISEVHALYNRLVDQMVQPYKTRNKLP